MKATTTSLAITGLGTIVSGIGAMLLKNRFGAGLFGFGLAHVVLGTLDMARPSIQKNS